MTRIVALDWAHKEEKRRVFDGKDLKDSRELETLSPGDIVLTENLPAKHAQPILEAGIVVKRCKSTAVAEMRKAKKIKKSDDNDVQLIYKLYETNPDAFRDYTMDAPIAAMYSVLQDFTGSRVATSNRLWANASDSGQEVLALMAKLEKAAVKAIDEKYSDEPIYRWLCGIKGIGPKLAGGLLAYTGDIGRFDTISKLWMYFGWGIKDGAVQKLKRGEPAGFHTSARKLTWLIGDSFIKQNTPVYRKLYDDEKARQKRLHPEMLDGHAHARALRKTVKVFLEHFYVAYRTAKYLFVLGPWIMTQPPHTHYIAPLETINNYLPKESAA